MSGQILPTPRGAPANSGPSPPNADLLRAVAGRLLRKAQQQGSVTPREIRDELAQAGLPAAARKEVLRLAGPSLGFRDGRYHYVPAGRKRMRIRLRLDQEQQRSIQQKVRWMIRRQRALESVCRERRACKRVEFCRPALVELEDQRCLRLFTREISLSGIRLLSGSSLQGQKVRVWVPFPEPGEPTHCFRVCILWSAAVGDNLYENGGVFLEAPDDLPPADNGEKSKARKRRK